MGRLDAVLHVAGFPLQPGAGPRVPCKGSQLQKANLVVRFQYIPINTPELSLPEFQRH